MANGAIRDETPTSRMVLWDSASGVFEKTAQNYDGPFLPLTGGTLTGVLALPAGSSAAPSLRFAGMATNDGMYGDANEVSIGFNGFRTFTVHDDTGLEAVTIRSDSLVPASFDRAEALGTDAIIFRVRVGGQTDLAITYAMLAAL
ncbi:unnamed protein product [marine sediment metagenome]|uniref:Uncharacterized protein n=1 Tax=marine sediment metagenome TaxID=412755 RepID=X1S1Q6_9ZZZZ